MENKLCHIKNRSASVVVYTIPEIGVRRSFAPGETKKIGYEELEKLTYQPGGINILTRFLQIVENQTIKDMGMNVEPEYFMNERDVYNLVKAGSLDEFLDALDFAPNGVIDLIKKASVDLPLLDISKRKALKEKTGFDVDAALKHIEEDKEDEGNTILKQANPQRRVVKDAAPATPGRRTTPKYNIITPKTEESAEVNN